MTGYIYLITNTVNGKQYVGQTTMSLDLRLGAHVSESKNKPTRPICLAIAKYGAESFRISLLEQCEVEELDANEIKWIEYYDSYYNGYNACKGGKGRRSVDYDDELLTSNFFETNCIAETARRLGLNHQTTRRRLITLGLYASEPRTEAASVYCSELNLFFSSAMDCATYLIENDLAKSSDKKTVAMGVRNVTSGRRKTYLKLHFTNPEQTG